MAPPRRFAVAAALLTGVAAQSGDLSSSDLKVWAAVAFVNNGDRSPDLSELHPVLTSDGAQQLYSQGQAFRSRYLTGSSSQRGITGTAPIEGLETDAIDNTQVNALSSADEYVAAGALAFLQALYPPNTAAFDSLGGGENLAHNFSSGSTLKDYPLGGYQYPLVETLSALDSQSPAIQGTVNCVAWNNEVTAFMTESDDLMASNKSSYSFYKTVFSQPPFNGTVDPSDIDFVNAYDIYDFVRYMYVHNETVHDNLENANDTLALLEESAMTFEAAVNGQVASNDSTNILHSVAGRTLASMISGQLSANIKSGGQDSKLTLLFGSYRPLLAFFSIVGLLSPTNPGSGPFSTLPQPGAAMVVELVGNDADDSNSMPDTESLQIRFFYRATADTDEPFTQYSLFGSGFDGSVIPYSSFEEQMSNLGRTSDQWCDICSPIAAPWCNVTSDSDSDSGDKSSSGGSTMSPVVAGVIGAVVTGAVVALVAAGLCLFGGFRLRRGGPRERERSSTLGGFKGAEKMASDKDVSTTKGGALQERIGSWELTEEQHPAPISGAAGIVTKDFQRRNAAVDDDGVDDIGSTPVGAHESI